MSLFTRPKPYLLYASTWITLSLMTLAGLMSSCGGPEGEPYRAVVDVLHQLNRNSPDRKPSQVINNPYVVQAKYDLLTTLAQQAGDGKITLYQDPQMEQSYPADSFQSLLTAFSLQVIRQLRDYKPVTDYYGQVPDTIAPWFHLRLDTLEGMDKDKRAKLVDSLFRNLVQLESEFLMEYELLLHEDWRVQDSNLLSREPVGVELVFGPTGQLLAGSRKYSVFMDYKEFTRMGKGLNLMVLGGGFQEEDEDLEQDFGRLLSSRRHVYKLVGLAKQTESVRGVPRDGNGEYLLAGNLPEGFNPFAIRPELDTAELFKRYPRQSAKVLMHLPSSWLPLFPNQERQRLLTEEQADSLVAKNRKLFEESVPGLLQAVMTGQVPIYAPTETPEGNDTSIQLEPGQLLLDLAQRNGVDPPLSLMMELQRAQSPADLAASAGFRQFVLENAVPHLMKKFEIKGELVRTADSMRLEFSALRLFYQNPDRPAAEMAVAELLLDDLQKAGLKVNQRDWTEILNDPSYFIYLVQVNQQYMLHLPQALYMYQALTHQPWESIAPNPYKHYDYEELMNQFDENRQDYLDMLAGKDIGYIDFSQETLPYQSSAQRESEQKPQPPEPQMQQDTTQQEKDPA